MVQTDAAAKTLIPEHKRKPTHQDHTYSTYPICAFGVGNSESLLVTTGTYILIILVYRWRFYSHFLHANVR